ncbi:hypothetical protein BC940DRAFT_348485 [Gongronella butleri]|nr:hypothetical protein BC940DRAFT_348485 [Gongronella butleri]
MEGYLPESGDNQQKRTRSDNTIRPITIKQLDMIELQNENNFYLDGAQVYMVTFVGVVRQISPHSTNIAYRLEDGTGQTEVRYWTEQQDGAGEESTSDIQLNTYVRVYGRLRAFNGKITVQSTAVRTIEDPNETTFHFLEAILSHASLQGKSGESMDVTMTDVSSNSINETVYRLISSAEEENGMHIDQVFKSLGNQYSESAIKEAIDFLSNEGRCYNTIDDEHIRSTEA